MAAEPYVPSTLEVKEAYVTAPDFMPYGGREVKEAEFDAWLAEVKANAVKEATAQQLEATAQR